MAAYAVQDVGIDRVAAITRLFIAAAASGTLGRDPDEYDEAAVRPGIERAARDGVCLGAFADGVLCGLIQGYRLEARRFHHVVAGVSAAVDPAHQGRGVGRLLFQAFLARVDAADPPVLRTELMLQAGNPAALHLYETLGFRTEGRLVDRVRAPAGMMIDDIQMARLRPNDI